MRTSGSATRFPSSSNSLFSLTLLLLSLLAPHQQNVVSAFVVVGPNSLQHRRSFQIKSTLEVEAPPQVDDSIESAQKIRYAKQCLPTHAFLHFGG
jgi:hypothetical protein